MTEIKMSISAHVLKIGLLLGYFDTDDVFQWAEKKINSGEQNKFLFELILANNKSDIIHFLIKISSPDSEDQFLVNEYFLSFYSYSLSAKEEEWSKCAIELLRYFALDEFTLSEYEKHFVSRLNDDSALRHDGFGGLMDMPAELFHFLKNKNRFIELQESLSEEGIPLLRL